MNTDKKYDLIVVGSGAAGLAAAVTFAETTEGAGTAIAILERSPIEERGGSTRWTGAFMRLNADSTLDTNYTKLLQDISGGHADVAYLEKFAEEVPTTVKFIQDRGVQVIWPGVPLPTTFSGGEVTMNSPALPIGGGKSIVEALAATLESHDNVDFYYDTEALRLTTSNEGAVDGILIRGKDGLQKKLSGDNVILACGGFEGNYEVLSRYVGAGAYDLPRIAPGIANNRGDGLRMALELGADTAGQFDALHVEPVDTRTTAADAVLYGYTAGIFVNADAKRFFDEGQNTWDNTFEKIGYEIWQNQDQKAYWVADAKTLAIPGIENLFISDIPPEEADTIDELAIKLGIDPTALAVTVAEFNAAVSGGEFDTSRLDGKHTTGLTPNKSNWATPIDQGPFIGFPLTGAICFVYGGIRTDLNGRVVSPAGVPIRGLYAAGELTGLYYNEYPPATSVLRSLTFGRLAAAHIAQSVRVAEAAR